jgi:hypothetical protein
VRHGTIGVCSATVCTLSLTAVFPYDASRVLQLRIDLIRKMRDALLEEHRTAEGQFLDDFGELRACLDVANESIQVQRGDIGASRVGLCMWARACTLHSCVR